MRWLKLKMFMKADFSSSLLDKCFISGTCEDVCNKWRFVDIIWKYVSLSRNLIFLFNLIFVEIHFYSNQFPHRFTFSNFLLYEINMVSQILLHSVIFSRIDKLIIESFRLVYPFVNLSVFQTITRAR